MAIRGWWWLLWRELSRRPGRVALVVFALSVSTAVVGLAVATVLVLSRDIEPRVRAMFPDGRIVARAKPLDISILRFDTAKITDSTVASIAALPGVTRVLPQLTVAFPSYAVISVGGTELMTDAILHGVPAELVGSELAAPDAWNAATGAADRPVPVLVSAFFLDLYNLGLAEGSSLPKLSPSAVRGREFDLVLGESSVGIGGSDVPSRTVKCRVVGLTANPRLVGIAVPMQVVRAWNGEYSPKSGSTYSAAHIDTAPGADESAIRASLLSMRLEADSDKGKVEAFSRVADAVRGLAAGAAALVAALAMVAIGSVVSASIRERRGAWGMMRASGIGRWALVGLAAAQGAVISAIGAIGGWGLAWCAARVVASVARQYTEASALIPDAPLSLPLDAALAIAAVSLVLVEVPTILLALRTSMREPAVLLAER